MRLSKIFEHLTNSTLAGLSIGGVDTGAVASADYPRLITLVNAGLIELYTQFSLRTREITLQLADSRSMYHLTSDHAESNTVSTDVKYILDGTTTYKFTDNIIVINDVYTEIGERLPLNDLHREFSVFTPSPTILQVPYASSENILAVVYRALPDIISTSLTDPSIEEIELPYHFIEALTSFIAWKLYASTDGGDNSPGRIHQGNYLAAIQVIKNTGTSIEDNFTNTRFGDNGWL